MGLKHGKSNHAGSDRDGVRVIGDDRGRPARRLWVVALLGIVALAFWFYHESLRESEVLLSQVEPAPLRQRARAGTSSSFKPVRRQRSQRPTGFERENASTGSTFGVSESAATDSNLGQEPSDGTDNEMPSGIALFPPLGTNPPKPGLIVPEDFELPPGFVRHYQATDDGKQLPAILMFHPDFDWVDAKGQPLELPEDGIVPPELAPADLPLEVLEIPEANIEFIAEPKPGQHDGER